MTTEIKGRCLCGGVSYVATAAPVMMLNCHCRDCQKASGGAFAAIAVFPKTSVQVHGDLRFHEVLSEHGDPVQRGFCPICGSRVANTLGRIPSIFNVMAGSLDDPSIFKPTVDVYTASAHPWDHMAPDTKKFAGGYQP